MFKSPEQALAFAFRVRETSVISLPSTVYIAQKIQAQSTSDTLTKYDLRAQAGMIFSFLSRRPINEQAYAFYLFGTKNERRLAAGVLARKYSGRFGRFGLERRNLRRAILARSVRDVAAECGLSNWKSWQLRREIAGVMEPARNSLMDALWQWLTNSGEEVSEM